MQVVNRGGVWVAVQFAVMIAILAAAPVWRDSWTMPAGRVAGVALIVFGAWAGLRGKRDLGRMRTPFPEPKDDGELITHGIYARMRHPLYASVMALGFAWALLWQSAPAIALAVVQAVLLHAKALREEEWLAAKHPSYADYAGRVQRYLPFGGGRR